MALFLLKTLFIYYVNKSILLFGSNLMVGLRTSLMKAYQSMPYSEYLNNNSADYINVILNLTNSLQAVVNALLRITSDIIVGIAIIVVLFIVSPLMVLSLVLLLGSIGFIYDLIFRNKLFVYGKNENMAGEEMLQGIREAIEGLKDIRILGKERYFFNIVKRATLKSVTYGIKTSMIQLMPRYILELFLLLFIVFSVTFSIFLGENFNDLIGVIILFGVASLRLVPIFNGVSNGILAIRHHRHSISRLYGDIRAHRVIERYGNKLTDSSDYQNLHKKSFRELQINKVSFSYHNATIPAVKDISIKIKENETIGIIGESGSGKTTLINVMLGLLEPEKGKILYNGFNIFENILDWHSQIAYLPQQVFLIDDTLRRNIALGDDDQIDDSRILKAIRQSQLLNLVDQLPNGIETNIGESGIRLSGGQRQRVALARAFYFGKNILIMDEATSALDNETEKEVIDEIRQIKGKKTIVIIAHRLSTVKHCDCIYHLKDGSIINCGSYSEVVKD